MHLPDTIIISTNLNGPCAETTAIAQFITVTIAKKIDPIDVVVVGSFNLDSTLQEPGIIICTIGILHLFRFCNSICVVFFLALWYMKQPTLTLPLSPIFFKSIKTQTRLENAQHPCQDPPYH